MTRALRAELVRTRGSAALLLTLTGLVFALLSSGFAATAHLSGTAQQLLGWQSLYATVLAAPMMTLIAGAVHERDSAAREGGTQWRSTPRRRIILARVCVLAGLSAVFHVLSYGGIAVVAMAAGLPGAQGMIAIAGAVSWLASLALIVPGLLVAELVGTVPAVLLALVGQIVGTLVSESPWWWAVPMSWPVRPCLWALRAHHNAVPLNAGERPIITEPWSSLALCIAVTCVAALALVAIDGRALRLHGSARRSLPAPRRSARGGALGACALSWKGTPILWLTIGALAMLGGAVILHRHGAAAGVFSYAVLPLGSIILPVVAWTASRDAWRIVVLRGAGPRRALELRLVAQVLMMSCAAAVAVLIEGDPAHLPRRLLFWVLCGSVVALVSLAISMRLSPGAAIAGGLLWWIFSVTFAGDVLAATPLWIVALPLWSECADTPGRLVIAVAVCAILLALAPFAVRTGERVYVRQK